jgi:hypothetical protein
LAVASRRKPIDGRSIDWPDRRRRQARSASASAADADQLGRPSGRRAACGRSSLTRVGPDGPGDTGRAVRPPRSGTRRARALPRRPARHLDPAGAASGLTPTRVLRKRLWL